MAERFVTNRFRPPGAGCTGPEILRWRAWTGDLNLRAGGVVWCGVKLDFSRPGKPIDDAYIEAFNGRFRAECVNAHWLPNLADAQKKTEDWFKYYNEERPHGGSAKGR
jgi:transposase InsO family protein